MSWWDYGYQITAMANRTILVDNNTWNNTHISRVGQVSWLKLWSNDVSALLPVLTVVDSPVGHGVHRGEGLWDHERAGCQLRPRYLWWIDGLLLRWQVPTFSLTEVEKSLGVFFCCFFSLCECLLHLFDGHPSESQISINFCGWFVSEGAPTRADTSKSTTTTPPPESSESTGKAHPSSSTVSCTRCATTASARSTQRPVSNSVAHMCIYIRMCQLSVGQ